MNPASLYDCIWLGTVTDEATMLASRAISPAANRWQRGLLGALRDKGVDTAVIGHVFEPLWPRGVPSVAQRGSVHGEFGKHVGYLNLPGIRTCTLHRSYLHELETFRKTPRRPAIMFSYNADPPFDRVCPEAQVRLGIPWVPIVADIPETRSLRERFDTAIGRAAGVVYLSWAAFRLSRHPNRLHLDGGVEELSFGPKETLKTGERTIFLYSGAMNGYAGVDLLVDAFALLPDERCQLWLCGKGTHPAVERAVREDPRITFFGLVPDRTLEQLSVDATAFVNPRLQRVGNQLNFPSKVLEYLRHGKPVVSTWTGGLSPEYEDIIISTKDATPEGLAAAMRSVADWPDEKRLEHRQSIARFLSSRLWSNQASRLSEWAERTVVPHGISETVEPVPDRTNQG